MSIDSVDKTISLAQIIQLVDGQVAASTNGSARNIPIAGVATLAEAEAGDLSYLTGEAHLKAFAATRASAVLVHKKLRVPEPSPTVVVLVEDAELAMAKVLELFAKPVPRPAVGVDPMARVDSSVSIGDRVAIGPFCFIDKGARIGDGCVIHSNVHIGQEVVLGSDCEIFSNVTLRQRIRIGSRVIIHAGSAIGSDGFGYRWDGKKHAKVPHIGSVLIEDDVEIGSCTCVDRGKFGDTRIGAGTKIDNLVQIAHNVQIGPHCIIVGQTGIAGSTTLGTGVILGGQTAVRDHIQLGDGAMVAACGAVHEDVPPKAIVSGMPALPHRQSLREQAALRRLPALVTQVRKLEEEIEAIRKQIQK